MNGGIGETETLSFFARFVRRSIGLHFAGERLSDLRQKMTRLAVEAGYSDLDGYLLRLMSEPLSGDRLDALVRALTIGETYFLRDPKSYQVFSDHLLPELVAARRSTDRSIRIWSAGCSTGEEPYTIAILLSRIIPDLDQWKITLLGTDINRESLERAERGIYGRWSFRNAPPWLMEYFDERPGGRYQIRPGIRKMVRFAETNLAGTDPLAKTDVAGEMDVIFCRNVMLYFGEREIARTMETFRGALKENGWLFIGPTEVNRELSEGFTLQHFDGAIVLRRGDGQKGPAEMRQGARGNAPAKAVMSPLAPSVPPSRKTVAAAGTPASATLPASPAPLPYPKKESGGTRGFRAAVAAKERKDEATPTVTAATPAATAPATTAPAAMPATTASPATGAADAFALYHAARYEHAAEAALTFTGSAEEQAKVLAMGARAFANIGKLEEARACCERAITCDRLSAPNHYLLSIILEQQGEKEAAVTSLKRALFIDHDFLVAYVALGNLARQSGDSGEAARAFNNALRLLEKRDPDEVLPEAEGMTAGRLAQVIREGLKRR